MENKPKMYVRVGSYEQLDKASLIKIIEEFEDVRNKLEIAEKALEATKYKSQILASHCAHRADSGGSLDPHNMFEKAQEIYESLEQALQQLRS